MCVYEPSLSQPFNHLDWPPTYSVRRSERARKIVLRVKPVQGLEIVIPAYRKRFNILDILEENRVWIEKTFKKFVLKASAEPTILAIETKVFQLECRAMGEIWSITYLPKPNQQHSRLKSLEMDKQLIISCPGELDNHEKYKYLLKRWLMKYAHQHLVPWISSLSEITGLSFQQIKIRGQSTLWGSCNAKKVISLNYKLIFLPNHLVKHVLLHELCHLRHLNHSLSFWNLLEKWDPEYLSHKKALKLADSYLPVFLRT